MFLKFADVSVQIGLTIDMLFQIDRFAKIYL